MGRLRGGLVFKAHRVCVSLNSRLERNEGFNCRGVDLRWVGCDWRRACSWRGEQDVREGGGGEGGQRRGEERVLELPPHVEHCLSPGSEEGSYLRLIDFCITELKA